MAEDRTSHSELLPPRQRLAWIAAIWVLSAGTMVGFTMAVRALLT
jgi:hypothetical protein